MDGQRNFQGEGALKKNGGWGQGCCLTGSQAPKAPSTFLEIRYSNELSFKNRRESSFKLTYLSLSINELLEKCILGPPRAPKKFS